MIDIYQNYSKYCYRVLTLLSYYYSYLEVLVILQLILLLYSLEKNILFLPLLTLFLACEMTTRSW